MLREAQRERDEAQREFDQSSRRYQNLVALTPLLTNKDHQTVLTGIEIFDAEANAGQAPLDL